MDEMRDEEQHCEPDTVDHTCAKNPRLCDQIWSTLDTADQRYDHHGVCHHGRHDLLAYHHETSYN
jgi:hypothetical protein